MIISHKHQFIFFAIPKTGSQSIRQALRTHLGADDLEQVELFAKRKIPIKGLEKMPHGHIKITELEGYFSKELRHYYKFAFIRNPLDRFVSTCFFMYNTNPVFKSAPRAFMKALFHQKDFLDRSIFMPQSAYLVNKHGQMGMNFIGDFARLQQDYDLICKRFSWPLNGLKHVNTSKHEHYSSYFDAELEALVCGYYQEDMARYKSLQ